MILIPTYPASACVNKAKLVIVGGHNLLSADPGLLKHDDGLLPNLPDIVNDILKKRWLWRLRQFIFSCWGIVWCCGWIADN